MGQSASPPPRQWPQPLRSHQPALQWRSQGCGPARQPAHRYPSAELLALPELAALKINADLSHWCCVCEHIFDPADPRDAWWPACLQLVARHCHFVHCRVGHAEGPQVALEI